MKESFSREMDYIKPETRYPQQECGIGVPVSKDGTADQIVQLRENINMLHELFTSLEQKLAPVRNFSPTCCEKEADKARNGSELRQALADQNDRLRVLRYRLNELMEEIDL